MKRSILIEMKRNTTLYVMLLPAIVYLIVFAFYPVFGGLDVSFQNVMLNAQAKQYIGLDNYEKILNDVSFRQALRNTCVFAFWNCFLGVTLSCAVAVMLNEIRRTFTRRFIQTIIYFPNLLSWVVIGSTFMFMLSPTVGPVNQIRQMLGLDSVFYFGSTNIIRSLIIFIGQWKSTGYGVIIYMAALIAIPAEHYEAATIDGANRFQQIFHITIPGISNTIKVMLMLNIMGMFQLFDSVYILGNRVTQNQTDVLMTYIYRTSLAKIRLGPGAAATVIMAIIALFFTLITKKITKFGFED